MFKAGTQSIYETDDLRVLQFNVMSHQDRQ